MDALVNGRDAVSQRQFRKCTACFGYPTLLSNGMGAAKSPNPHGRELANGMDAVN